MTSIQNPMDRYPEFLKGLLGNTTEIATLLDVPHAEHIVENILELDAAWYARLAEVRSEYLTALATKLNWPQEKIDFMQKQAKKNKARILR